MNFTLTLQVWLRHFPPFKPCCGDAWVKGGHHQSSHMGIPCTSWNESLHVVPDGSAPTAALGVDQGGDCGICDYTNPLAHPPHEGDRVELCRIVPALCGRKHAAAPHTGSGWGNCSLAPPIPICNSPMQVTIIL